MGDRAQSALVVMNFQQGLRTEPRPVPTRIDSYEIYRYE
jgi:hypothetical protein